MPKFILFDEVIEFTPDIELRIKANKRHILAYTAYLEKLRNFVETNDVKNPDVVYELMRPTLYKWLDDCFMDLRQFAEENNRPIDEKQFQESYDIACGDIDLALIDFEWDYEIFHNMHSLNKIRFNSRNKAPIMLTPQAEVEAREYWKEKSKELWSYASDVGKTKFIELYSIVLSNDARNLLTSNIFTVPLHYIYESAINIILRIFYRKDPSMSYSEAKRVSEQILNDEIELHIIMEHLPELISNMPFCGPLYDKKILNSIRSEKDRESYLQIAKFLEMDNDLH